ncbi:MAG: RidA family protein [Promethearchaeota archaeon]
MKEIVKTEKAPKAIGPYSQANIIDQFVFTAGQLGIDPQTSQLVKGGIKEEAEQALKNLGAILESAGSSFLHVIKCTVFLADMNEFQLMNEVYKKYFGEDTPPARSAVQVAKLPLNGRIEIEAIAFIPK